MKASNIKIGYWYTMCCHLDREQILTQETIDYIKNDIESGMNYGIAETEKELLELLLELYADESMIKEVKDLLNK